ncbi:MAG: hypothetical protein ACQEP2_01385 [Actinomycetota bacterium]
MVEQNLIAGISIGVFSYSCLYLGKGLQKLGINRIKSPKQTRTKGTGI